MLDTVALPCFNGIMARERKAMQTYGVRFTGEAIPVTALGECDVAGCSGIAYKENCNAESSEGRMHWHGKLHVASSRFGSGQLCPHHAEECREEWRELREAKASVELPG